MALIVAVLLLVLQSLLGPAFAQGAEEVKDRADQPAAAASLAQAGKPAPSLEEKMRRRFPQPVRVGDLIGLPVLDDDDSTIGYIRDVVRTPSGKIQLVVPYARWFGWVSLDGPFDWNRRPVAVPIETVVILGRQLDALDMSREAFDAAPTFDPAQATSIGPEETIKVALGRR